MIFVYRDAGAAGPAALRRFAEAPDDVGFAPSGFVLQRDQKSAFIRGVVAVVEAAPGVDVQHAIRRHGNVSCVAEAVREDAGAEAGRELQAAVVRMTA